MWSAWTGSRLLTTVVHTANDDVQFALICYALLQELPAEVYCVCCVLYQGYVIVLVLIAFEGVVRVRQAQYYNQQDRVRPPHGIVFSGITRADADRDLTHCAKFLINYAFYKFGREVSMKCFLRKSKHILSMI